MTFEQFLQLANAPERVLLVLLVLAIIVGAIKQWWVPGWLYRLEVAKNEALTATLKALTETVATVGGLEAVRKSLDDLKALVTQIADDFAWNLRDRAGRGRGDRG